MSRARYRVVMHFGRRMLTLPNSHGESVPTIDVPAQVTDAVAIDYARRVYPNGTPDRARCIRMALIWDAHNTALMEQGR